jgi:DnaJ-domain-containing protein 1
MALQAEYREQISAQLQEVQAEIDELQAKTAQIETEARAKYDELIKNLHTSTQTVRDELMELVEAEAWDKLKEKMTLALNDLREAVRAAAAQCK